MWKWIVTPRRRRHREIVARLDAVVGLLSELKKEMAARSAAMPAGKKYYTNSDLCAILSVSKRTLARYRQAKLITYYMINGKNYYKASEIEEFLKRQGKF